MKQIWIPLRELCPEPTKFQKWRLAFFIIMATSASAEDMSVSISEQTMTPMKSPWADYFGTHYARSLDEAGKSWNTVRSYGGTHVGIFEENPSAPAREGPFTGRDVRFSLEDFHGPRSGGSSAMQLIPDLIQHRVTGLYLITNLARPALELYDKDRVYWGIRQIHEKFPEASNHIVWQMGNEVVSGHFDPKGLWERGGGRTQGDRPKAPPQGGREDNFFGYNLKWKEDYYVNDFLAPAIEATERASMDVYRDPRRIQIALGSMNPYNWENISFLASVMSRSFDSKQAPTLKGEPVWKHIDLLTVHYMTGSPGTIATLQKYHDDYLKTGKVKGIWITEDHGRAGKGPVTILDRGLRFLDWAARNHLSGEQTRLCWWGENDREAGGSGAEASHLLGGFLASRPLQFSQRHENDATLTLLTDSVDGTLSRGFIAIVPERFGTVNCSKVTITLPAAASAKNWSARAVNYSLESPPQISAVSLSTDGNALVVPVNTRLSGALLLLFAEDPSSLPKPTPQ